MTSFSTHHSICQTPAWLILLLCHDLNQVRDVSTPNCKLYFVISDLCIFNYEINQIVSVCYINIHFKLHMEFI